MPRKKPFSNKQKKKQLAEKRHKKKGQNEDNVKRHQSHSESKDEEESDDKGSEEETVGLHHQPVDSNIDRTRDPNRFLLKFGKESKAELEERKKQALDPIVFIDEHDLEKSIESVYRPGSVLDMPKRPSWNYKMSKHKVEKNEEEIFDAYKEKIFSQYNNSELSYFECNLETWRQLWRVLEVSDIVIIVADVRFPILHFSPALYDYVVNDLKKKVILLLNKIDLIEPELVVAWQHYFKSKYQDVDVVCFTSFPKDEQERKTHHGKVIKRGRRKRRHRFAIGAQQLHQACSRICGSRVDLTDWEMKIEHDLKEEDEKFEYDSEESEGEEAEQKHHDDVLHDYDILTIGLVGHPNVGKSSLLNGLVGKKVVSTSRTPGHTKHFQTIFLTPNVRLCDSPGLVFPSLVDKQLQILSGLYPISQVQEPYTSVGYLAARWPLITILRLVHPTDNETLNAEEKQQSIGSSKYVWSAMDVCDAWAEQRGYLTAKAGRNDTYRAANSILRLAVEGKIPFYFYPPGFIAEKEKWKNHPDTKIIYELQERHKVDDDSNKNIESESDSGDDEAENDTPTNAPVMSSNPFALLADD